MSNLGLKLTSLPERKSEPTRLTVALDILEPCFWEPEHPFCYEVHLELHDDERLLDMRRIVAGIRHLTVEDQELLLNGQSYFVQGTWHSPSVTIAQLEAWHEVDCRAFLVQATTDLCMRTDRWGPMILHLLPPVEADARDQVIRLRNHPSVLLWVIPALITGEYLERYIETIRDHDPSRLIGQLIAADQPIAVGGPIEVVLLPAGHPMIGTSQCNKPYIVVGPSADEVARVHADDFAGEIASFREQVGSPAGLVGLIL